MNRLREQITFLEKPHRDDHFLLIIAFRGFFHFKIDFNDVILHAPFVLAVEPDQVHQIIAATNEEGWVLGIEEFILETEFQHLLETKLLRPHPLPYDDNTSGTIDTLLKLVYQLQQEKESTYTEKSILHLINALFCLLQAETKIALPKESSKEKRGYIIEQSFRQLLKRNFKDHKTPSYYAAELAISVSHLNDTIKHITGTPVSTHIQLHNITEAKRLLYFTNLGIKEICYSIGYDDPVYFGKLFKKITKLTPIEFRKQFRD